MRLTTLIEAQRIDGMRRDVTDSDGTAQNPSRLQWLVIASAAVLVSAMSTVNAPEGASYAYIGPGAGVALVGSLFAVLAALMSAVITMLTWPIRRIWRAIRGQ